jgi:hypothetical protein
MSLNQGTKVIEVKMYDPSPESTLAKWNNVLENGNVLYHPRKFTPNSTIHKKLVTYFPNHFQVDISSSVFSLFMVMHFVLKLINPLLQEYSPYHLICLTGIWEVEVQQTWVTINELTNLIKRFLPPVNCTEQSLKDSCAHLRIPLKNEKSKWFSKNMLLFPSNAIYAEILFPEIDTSILFKFSEPLRTIVTQHYKKADSNFSLNSGKPKDLLEIVLKMFRQNDKFLDGRNKNVLQCAYGTALFDTFGPEQIHIGEFVKYFWKTLKPDTPPNYSPFVKHIIESTQKNHTEIVDLFEAAKRRDQSATPFF